MKKIIFIFLGLVSVTLGVLGIFLPVLPTTPFLLLASYLFMKSSDRLYNFLMEHPLLGLYIKSYVKYGGVEKKYKIRAIFILWAGMAISIYLIGKIWVKFLLVVIGAGVTIHILSLKTLSPEESIEIENEIKKENLKEKRI